MEEISFLADIGFLLPPFAAVLLMLCARREVGLAARWGGAVIAAAAATAVLKSVCRDLPGFMHFPSGHVSLAVAFYGGLAALILGRGGWAIVPVILVPVAAIEGWSRVELTEHTWGDVGGGFLVAVVALALVGLLSAGWRLAAESRGWVLIALLAAAPAGYVTYPWLGHSLRTLAQ